MNNPNLLNYLILTRKHIPSLLLPLFIYLPLFLPVSPTLFILLPYLYLTLFRSLPSSFLSSFILLFSSFPPPFSIFPSLSSSFPSSVLLSLSILFSLYFVSHFSPHSLSILLFVILLIPLSSYPSLFFYPSFFSSLSLPQSLSSSSISMFLLHIIHITTYVTVTT